MLIKFNEMWLRDCIENLTCDSETLSDQLVNLGFEIESKKLIPSSYNTLLVGEIVDFKIYKKSSNLINIKINIGKKENLNIITTIKNYVKNSKVIISKKNTNKYYEFNLCSYSDLFINNNPNIIILPNYAKTGDDPAKYIQIKDFSYKLNITSNRSDCLSIIGIARDLAAFNKINLKNNHRKQIIPTLDLKKQIFLKTDKFPSHWIKYNFCIIKNICINIDTPLWIKEKLIRNNIQYSQNILSNIYNYILLKYGQPIFFFDLDSIDSFIHIRMAKEKEICELSKNNIILNKKTLVVSDRKKILLLAGITNSIHANINMKTKNIIIDCSFFHPSIIIGQTNLYKLPANEISYRYERGIDPCIQKKVIEKTVDLILNVCGGKVSPIINNIDDITFKTNLKKLSKNIYLTKDKLNKLVGFVISESIILDILKRLGFSILNANKKKWLIQVPSWRFDIFFEEDLIEEIIRIYGYNNIPSVDLFSINNINYSEKYKKKYIKIDDAKKTLIERGYQEVINYSFVNPKYQKIFHPKKNFLSLKNPISLEMSSMRLSIFSGLISTFIYNQNRKKNRIRLFESGICFLPKNNGKKIKINQELVLSAIISGNCYDINWGISNRLVDFYDIKGDLESLLDKQNNLEYLEFKNEENIFLHPHQSATIYLNKKKIGFIGALNPDIEKKLNIKNHIFLFEIFWNKVSNFFSEKKINKISKLPCIERDISFLINKKFSAQQVIKTCKNFFFANKIDLIDINIFDVYQNNKFDKKYKSFSISLIIQNNKKNLKEKEISDIIIKCLDYLKKNFNILPRDKKLLDI